MAACPLFLHILDQNLWILIIFKMNFFLLMKNEIPTRCHLLLYYAYFRLNMFWAPLCPSSEAHNDSVGYHIGRLVLVLLLVGG